MKWTSFICLALVLTLSSCGKNPSSSCFVVAKGKGLKITRGDLNKERDEQIHVLNISKEQIPDEQFAAIDAQILDQMINKELLLNEISKDRSIDLDKEVNETLKGIQSRFPSAEEFNEQLKKSNLTVDKIKKEIKYQVAMEKVLQKRFKPEELTVPDADAEAFYKDNPQFWQQPDLVKAQHILVFIEPSATEEMKKAKKKAINDARQRIAKGEAFEKVAAEVSEDPATKDRGGELPPFGKESKIAPDFTDAVFKQKVGQLGPVFSSSYGYHLVKVIEKTPARTVPFEEVKDAVKRQLEVRKKMQAIQQVLKKMRDDTGVQIFLQAPAAKDRVTAVPAPAPAQQPPPAAPQEKAPEKKP